MVMLFDFFIFTLAGCLVVALSISLAPTQTFLITIFLSGGSRLPRGSCCCWSVQDAMHDARSCYLLWSW